jgi:HK97 family phage major capsid protein
MRHVPPGAFALSNPLRAIPRAIIGNGVRADNTDPKAMIAAVQTAVTELRASLEEKLKSKVDDAVLNEKIDRIDGAVDTAQKAIDEMNAKLAAASLGGAGIGDLPATDPEYVKSFKAHMRKGDVNAALQKGTDADGGYLAPVEWDRTITNKLKLVSPIRQYATVQPISTAGFKKLFNDRAIGSGWVGETAPRPATSTPQIGQLDFIPGELYANPAATQQLLDDAAIDIEQWLANEVDTEFARQEGIAFVSGDGANKPYGFLTYVTGGANATRHPFGAIEVINSGAAAAYTSDAVIDMVYALPAMYQANARFFANRLSFGALRKLKDGNGNYLWQPSFQAGQPSTLAGTELVDVPDMPAATAGNLALAYGDMAETYLIIDRIGIRVLRDPYTNKPFVHFYTTKRVGGGVKNPNAMKVMKIGTGA